VSRHPRAPAWQRWLAALVLATILLLSPPAWASITLLASACGVILFAPVIARRHELNAASATVEAGVVLGTEVGGGAPVALSDRQLQAHGVIVGASGSGKSTTLLMILSDQIARGAAVVAVDMKGSPAFAAALARAASAAGREFRVWTPDGGAVWNPLAHGNATELKDKLISMERFSEIHYQRAAERYLQLVLQALKLTRGREQAPTLHDVVALMDPTRLEGLLRAVPAHFADHVHRYLAELTPDQLSAVRGLGTRLAIIDESHTGRFLGGPGDPVSASVTPAAPAQSVDLRAALRGEQVVLFSLNSSSYGKLSAQLGALAIQDLITAVGERTRDPSLRHRALVALDEFSGLDDDRILGLNARCREAGVGFVIATQEPTDFERAGRGLRDQIFGSTAVKIVHRLDVPSSAEMIAKLAGTETVLEYSPQLERHPLFGNRETGRGSAREVERFLVHPNVIKTLPTGEAVVITKVPEARVRVVQVSPLGVTASAGALPHAWDQAGAGRGEAAIGLAQPRNQRALLDANANYQAERWEQCEGSQRGPVAERESNPAKRHDQTGVGRVPDPPIRA
jgi:conjugal transfer pilus assembly protein TraD